MTLLLRASCEGEDTVKLLRRAVKTVGVPNLIWSTNRYAAREELLKLSQQPHDREIRCAILLSDFPSDDELRYAINEYAARYPLGRLAVLSNSDLRILAYEQKRFLRVVEQI